MFCETTSLLLGIPVVFGHVVVDAVSCLLKPLYCSSLFSSGQNSEILKTCKNEFDCLKMIFFIKADIYWIIFAKFQVIATNYKN